MADGPKIVRDSQFDFSGGENSVSDKALLKPNECSYLNNAVAKRGGGVSARLGYKNLGVIISGHQISWIGELEQSGLQMLYNLSGASWYDQSAQPTFQISDQIPVLNAAFYWGSRQKFFQLVLYLVSAFTPANATQGIVWELSKGGGTWLDITASMIGTADNKKLAAATLPAEVPLSWPDNSQWIPQQVNTQGYQYWIRARVTVAAQDGLAPVIHGQRRVVTDAVGTRKVFAVGGTIGYELPGFTLTKQDNGMGPGTTELRMGGAQFGDYLYYHASGTQALKRWNGCRGSAYSGYSNLPANAGLTAPVAPTAVLGASGLASGYVNNAVIRARLSKLHGPGGVLGESPVGPSVEFTCPAAGGFHSINWRFLTAKANAAADDVHGFRLYVTSDLQNVTNVNERDRPDRFLLLKEILRDDVDWAAGAYAEANAARTYTGDATPLLYTNTPPFYPKGVATGGERLWMWNDNFVACSDVRRGESWNPTNQFKFQNIQSIGWYEGSMYVFQADRISAIRDINTTLPYTERVVDGLGCVQPESLTAIPGGFLFVSRLGPARFPTQEWFVSRDPNDLLIGLGRVFESSNYWSGKVGERRYAQGAYFNHRWLIPIDDGQTQSFLITNGIFDLRGGWSRALYRGSSGSDPLVAMGIVHGTLEHALADQLCLLASPGGGDQGELWILEYGTTDRWTTNPYDGNMISIAVYTRGLSMTALQATKRFLKGHIRVRFPKASTDRFGSVGFPGDILPAISAYPAFQNTPTSPYLIDHRWEPSDTSAGGSFYEENCPVLQISANTDNGFDLTGWRMEAEVEESETGWPV